MSASQLSGKLAQYRKKAEASQHTKKFLLLLLILTITILTPVLVMVSFKVAKQPADTQVKEVYDRHLGGLVLAYLLYTAFLVFAYTINLVNSFKLFAWLFYGLNLVFAFSIMVIASDATKKIKDAGKADQYKDYLKVLGGVIGLSVMNIVVVLLWIAFTPAAAPAGTSQQKH